jgi:beta-N-acetylhexosaminidase
VLGIAARFKKIDIMIQHKAYGLPFFGLLISVLFSAYVQSDHSEEQQEAWVDHIFQSLSEEQRIAQLFLVAAYANKDEAHYSAIEELIQRYNIGGVLFFQGTPSNQVALTNRYQQAAKTPLLIAMDAEWGLGMRLDHTISYPKQMTLGALQDDTLIYAMGTEIARQLKRIGVHINFAPVMDVNNNPNNPVIGRRSFGECKEQVASKGIAYIKGLQDHGILAVAKHFPGHGDTNKDSHDELPTIAHDRNRLDTLELFPFKKAIAAGIQGMMIAHLHVPAYDATPQRATTLTKKVVTDLLKKQLWFQGLVFTDALNMQGVSTHHQPGEVDLLALQAGNDVLVFPEDVPKAISLIAQAIKGKKLDGEAVNEKVKRLLRLKYQMQLHTWQPIETQNLEAQLNTPQAHLLKQQLFEGATTVVANDAQLIPLRDLRQCHIACLSLISENTTKKAREFSKTAIRRKPTRELSAAEQFPSMLKKYAPIAHHTLTREAITSESVTALAGELKRYQVVIVGIHGMHERHDTNFGIKEEELQLLKSLEKDTALIIVPFGSVYSLVHFKNFKHVIMPYEDDTIAARVVPQIIFGAVSAEGKLPVSIPGGWEAGWGIRTANIARLGYALPEAVHIDSQVLQEIDDIVTEAIAEEATPGCQVLVARSGKVVFDRSYGHHTYEKRKPVTPDTMYDIASVTKVVGTLQALMYLVGKKQLNVKKKLSFYLPSLKGTNKGALRIHHILAHQAGLPAYLWGSIKHTLIDADGRLRKALFSTHPSPTYQHRLANDLYGATWLKELVWDHCVDAALRDKSWFRRYDYQYGCIGAYLLHHLAEKLLAQPLDNFLEATFYRPLGLATLTYRPLHKFPQDCIAPTGEDNFFRKDFIQGVVHDPMAALYGGVAGNSGLFSNVNDLAVLLQMNLQDGYYGGEWYFPKGVVQTFAKKKFKNNRRGLGWDKPSKHKSQVIASAYASVDSYGHSGFTGALVWVDPKYDLIYVFLSNRTCPDVTNNRLSEKKVRTKIHDVVYKAIKARLNGIKVATQ